MPVPDGVLLLHGFTGNPTSMAGLAVVFEEAGFAVELPRLPGHGTVVEDMLDTGWADWAGEALAAYDRLAARVAGRIVVAGLSMGGSLACRVVVEHPEVVGLICVNPAVEPPGEALFDILRLSVEQGIEVAPSIGSDIARPGVTEGAYESAPLRPALSLYAGIVELAPRLAEIRCPLLLFNSPQDHVVPP